MRSFTIAIPTYNNCKTISKTINSAINQSYNQDYEILVLNNNSTDDTTDILNAFGDKIKVINNEQTVSMYENHNLCLKNASGDYIIFCHADDTLISDALVKIKHIVQDRNYPEQYVLWGRSMFRDYFVNWHRGGFQLNQIAAGVNALGVMLWGGLTPSGTCYSRKSFLKAGGFLIGKHKLAPSDYVSMWKLVLLQFEFEMSDRIFFIRENASTATGTYYTDGNINDSILELIEIFRNDMGSDCLAIIQKYIYDSDFFYTKLIYILAKNQLINKKDIRGKVIKFFLKNPLLLRNSEAFKLFVSVI